MSKVWRGRGKESDVDSLPSTEPDTEFHLRILWSWPELKLSQTLNWLSQSAALEQHYFYWETEFVVKNSLQAKVAHLMNSVNLRAFNHPDTIKLNYQLAIKLNYPLTIFIFLYHIHVMEDTLCLLPLLFQIKRTTRFLNCQRTQWSKKIFHHIIHRFAKFQLSATLNTCLHCSRTCENQELLLTMLHDIADNCPLPSTPSSPADHGPLIYISGDHTITICFVSWQIFIHYFYVEIFQMNFYESISYSGKFHS